MHPGQEVKVRSKAQPDRTQESTEERVNDEMSSQMHDTGRRVQKPIPVVTSKNSFDFMSEPRQPRRGQRRQRQLAAPRLKTQFEIGKEYKETPWGRKSIYAASPYCEEVLRKYAAKYTEVLEEGTLRGIPVTADLLKQKSRQMRPGVRVKYPNHENTLNEIFQDLRKHGIRVDGKYLSLK